MRIETAGVHAPVHARRGVVFLTSALACTLWFGRAQAATVQIDEASTIRKEPLRDQAHRPLWFSKSDCLADDVITYRVLLSDFGSEDFEVWVGSESADCASVSARSATTATCWQVWKGKPSADLAVPIRVRDIVGHHLPTGSGGPGSGTAQDCIAAQGLPSAPAPIGLFFLSVDAADQSSQGGAVLHSAVDIVPPVAPREIMVGRGDRMLRLEWLQSLDVDVEGYTFFCDPQPGSGSGAATDAGTCESSKLVPGAVPDWSFACGHVVGVAEDHGSVTGLTNGVYYSIGVAALDTVGNVGNLSSVVCASPIQAPVERSESNGGCATSRGSAGGPVAALVLASGAVVAARRRRRR